jgi:hypothetical protein
MSAGYFAFFLALRVSILADNCARSLYASHGNLFPYMMIGVGLGM